jgi:BirA family transcriptional regulator, biotin operon repressor / biotin---[acetyl-CoA-carboxylase] ligase
MKLDWFKGYSLISYEEIDSTNSEALRLASAGISGDSIILAHNQTGGRGSKGRYWTSIPGNLHASILLENKFSLKKNSQLSFVIANAVFQAINYLAKLQNIEIDMQLKWPNDILINDQKVAGILLESISIRDKNYVVIGFGINLKHAPVLNNKAICLTDLGIKINSADEFLNILMGKFERLYQQWKIDNNFIKTRKDWMRHAYKLNKVITIDDGARRISGVFKEIDLDGAMRLQLASGQYCNIVAGELMFSEDV